jgi:hypothetical protein
MTTTNAAPPQSALSSQRALATPRAGTATVNAQPPVVNLLLYQGDDVHFDLVVTNPDGSAADLTGMTPAAQIRDKPNGALIATFMCSIATNVISLHLPATESVKLSAPGVWDCQITSATPEVTTLAAGTVSTAQQVTAP